MKLSTRDMILAAIFAAVTAIFSVITIPIGPIPVTLGVFGVLLSAVVLGGGRSVLAVFVFILVGLAGLPVFSGFRGGAGVILGPTGGYLSSYFLMALITSSVSSALKDRYDFIGFSARLGACLLSVAVCYALGTIQFIFITKKTLTEALALCVYPFVALDILKCVGAVALGQQVKKRIHLS